MTASPGPLFDGLPDSDPGSSRRPGSQRNRRSPLNSADQGSEATRPGAAEPASDRQVLSVTELNAELRNCLQQRFQSVWVAGEITDLARPRSGHIYLTLKDDQGILRAIIWRSTASRLAFDLEDGMQVICEGQIDIYPPRGNYQLIIRKLEPQGVGALQLALQQLREKLQAEGLFDGDRKRALPRFPRRIAIVTSPTGAAIRDFLEVHRRRWSGTQLVVIPTRVQGAEAGPEIARAIRSTAQLCPAPDAVVVTRGGGSLEDLWCFNDEQVVRTIAAHPIPVISAVGHEIDVTLCDLVADLRALTPSEAAERISPSREDVRDSIEQLERRLHQIVSQQLSLQRTRLDSLATRRVLHDPVASIHDRSRRLDDLEDRMQRATKNRLERIRQQIQKLTGQLEALSPLDVLRRGYSVAHNQRGQLIRSVEEVATGDLVRTRLPDGELLSRVETTAPFVASPGDQQPN